MILELYLSLIPVVTGCIRSDEKHQPQGHMLDSRMRHYLLMNERSNGFKRHKLFGLCDAGDL